MLVPWVPDSRTNTKERQKQRNRKLERIRDREKKNEKVDSRVSWASDLSDMIDQRVKTSRRFRLAHVQMTKAT